MPLKTVLGNLTRFVNPFEIRKFVLLPPNLSDFPSLASGERWNLQREWVVLTEQVRSMTPDHGHGKERHHRSDVSFSMFQSKFCFFGGFYSFKLSTGD